MRFFSSWILGFLLALTMVAIGPIAVDPLGVWHASDQVRRPDRFENERVFKPYEAMFRPRKVVFVGSSRIAYTLPAEWPGVEPGGVYNLAIGGATIDEVLALGDWAVDHLRPEHLVLGMDLRYFNYDSARVREGFSEDRLARAANPLTRTPWKLWETSLSFQAVHQAWSAAQVTAARPVVEPAWRDGTYVRYEQEQARPDWDSNLYNLRGVYGRVNDVSDADIARVRTLVERARAAGTEVHVFVTPTHADAPLALEAAGRWDKVEELKRDLVAAVGTVFDAYRVSEWQKDRENFADLSHVDAAIGAALVAELAGAPPEHGVWLTEENLPNVLRQDRRALAGWKARYPQLSRAMQKFEEKGRSAFGKRVVAARVRDELAWAKQQARPAPVTPDGGGAP